VTQTKTEGRIPVDLEETPVEVGVRSRVELVVDGLERIMVELERIVVELERVVVELERVANGPPLP